MCLRLSGLCRSRLRTTDFSLSPVFFTIALSATSWQFCHHQAIYYLPSYIVNLSEYYGGSIYAYAVSITIRTHHRGGATIGHRPPAAVRVSSQPQPPIIVVVPSRPPPTPITARPPRGGEAGARHSLLHVLPAPSGWWLVGRGARAEQYYYTSQPLRSTSHRSSAWLMAEEEERS